MLSSKYLLIKIKNINLMQLLVISWPSIWLYLYLTLVNIIINTDNSHIFPVYPGEILHDISVVGFIVADRWQPPTLSLSLSRSGFTPL